MIADDIRIKHLGGVSDAIKPAVTMTRDIAAFLDDLSPYLKVAAICHLLMTAFNWGETEEGGAYWNEVHNKLRMIAIAKEES